MTTHIIAGPRRVLLALTAAGLRATMDPRNLNPPCVMVTPSDTTRLTVTRCRQTVEVSAVVPGAANLDALTKLDSLTGAVLNALDVDGLPWTEARYTTITAPTGEDLLAYTLTVPLTLEV
jgi:hypothetical protein